MKKGLFLEFALLSAFFAMQGCRTSLPTAFTVGTYNLRNANHSDSINGNGWGQRYPVIAKMAQFNNFDIFGTQEGFLHQLQDLKSDLPDYDFIGVGRDDGKEKGEHSAIFYRTDKFDLLDKGDFWLSENPDKPAKGWDAVLPRICSWGHFKYKKTGFEFLFFNLHMDHVGTKARVESARLVLKKIKEMGSGLPAILTGDFNVDQTSNPYKELAESGFLKDSYLVSNFRYTENGTFNGYDANSFTSSRIDHVFVSPSFTVDQYGILTDTYRVNKDNGNKIAKVADYPAEITVRQYEARTPSDHFPVKVVLEYKNKK